MYNVPPAYYDYNNAHTSWNRPGSVHSQSTVLVGYFRRYLLQKAMSVYKWGMPDTWATNYFLYTLYCRGYLAIVETDRFGVICQGCGLKGYNVYYQPTQAIIANPLLKGILEPRIGEECVLLKMQPDYGSIMDLINYYAEEMALCSEAVSVNLINSKMAYVLGAKNKSTAESLKNLYDRVASGEPAVAIDRNLLDDSGKPTWLPFSQDLKTNYIVSDVLADMRKIEAMFCTAIGIPNANTDKRERLITDEVNANNSETSGRAQMWLEELQAGCEEARDMFGINLTVEWRTDPMEGGVPDAGTSIDPGRDKVQD